MNPEQKYKIGDHVRLRHGCVWLFGIVTEYLHDGFYDCDYGTRGRYEALRDGWSYDYFATWHEDNMKIGINPH